MKSATRLPVVLFSALALLVLASCGPSETSSDGSAPAPAAEKRFLSIGTAPTGGAFFVVGGALADVADELGPEGWNVSAEATAGSQENIRRLTQGELDFALANAAISYFAVRGESSWEQTYPIRAVMTLAPNVALFVTPEGSGVESVGDLRGKRVTVGPAGAGFEMFVGPLVAAHGLTYDDFTPLNATQTGAVDLLSDGSAVAAFLGGAVPTASISQAASSMDLRLVPYGDDAKQSLVADYPFFAPATIPAGTYRGQEADYVGLNVGSMQLITGAAVDEELVYQLTRTIYENRANVVERHPAGKAIQPGNVVRDTGTPFHPGAIRYYKEIGIWPEEEAGAGESTAEGDEGT
ncbi:MAG: TAXI family TRAP transporter solute-binding subunit [bacterium]|nr:TAXI family TRAP transporter solute-binding subunit [bacterium]